MKNKIIYNNNKIKNNQNNMINYLFYKAWKKK